MAVCPSFFRQSLPLYLCFFVMSVLPLHLSRPISLTVYDCFCPSTSLFLFSVSLLVSVPFSTSRISITLSHSRNLFPTSSQSLKKPTCLGWAPLSPRRIQRPAKCSATWRAALRSPLTKPLPAPASRFRRGPKQPRRTARRLSCVWPTSWKFISLPRVLPTLQVLNHHLQDNKHEVALLDCLEGGKPISVTLNTDLPDTIECLRFHAEAVDKLNDVCTPVGPDALSIVVQV